MTVIQTLKQDLIIIGAGMAGMAAALFAAQRGIRTVQVGVPGELGFASGLLDLLGVHPVEKGRRRVDPWVAIKRLVADDPLHPYAHLTIRQIRLAMDTLLSFLKGAGLPYQTRGRRNVSVLTPVGTLKTTYGVPATMMEGVNAFSAGKPVLLVDFLGMKGYSTRQIMESIRPLWPDLRGIRVPFPDISGVLWPEQAARQMEVPQKRRRIAELIVPEIRNAQAVGFPAMLGTYRTTEIMNDLEKLLGVPVFEIPTMPPSVPGLRLRETFAEHLPGMDVKTFYQHKVFETRVRSNGDFSFLVGRQAPEFEIQTSSAFLASGRFFGKGLRAGRTRIRETLFDLPVHQPAERSQWHHKTLLDSGGHRINRAGVMVDGGFRPVDGKGQLIHERLYAVGSILAHQDWMRQKCGSGLAIATAYGAVQGMVL